MADNRYGPVTEAKRHILLVDDTPDGREPLARLLRMSGYEVSCAGGGEEALELLAARPVDLMILDLMMPHMSGEEVLREVRGNAATAQLPVIVFSASENRAKEIERLCMMGVREYIQKTSITFPDLLKRVEHAMGNGNATDCSHRPGTGM